MSAKAEHKQAPNSGSFHVAHSYVNLTAAPHSPGRKPRPEDSSTLPFLPLSGFLEHPLVWILLLYPHHSPLSHHGPQSYIAGRSFSLILGRIRRAPGVTVPVPPCGWVTGSWAAGVRTAGDQSQASSRDRARMPWRLLPPYLTPQE